MAAISIPVEIEQQALAAYDRTRLDKILMLLYPVSQKVVYTEFGLSRLKLNKNRLPSYKHALTFTSVLLVIPYRKGRSEAEVASFLGPANYINDIHEPPLYKGDLVGNGAQLDKYLEVHPLFSCLDIEHQVISVTLRDHEIDPVQDIGSMVTAKPARMELNSMTHDGYVIYFSVDYRDIAVRLTSCASNIIGYVIAARNNSGLRAQGNSPGHAMALIIDKQQRTIELSDSNGYTPIYSFVNVWLEELVNGLNQIQPIHFTIKYSFNMGYCPQWRTSVAINDRNTGQCLVWTWYYLWLRNNNPHRSAEEIVRHIMAMTAVQLQDRIERVGSIIYNNYTFGDLTDVRNIKSLLSSETPHLYHEQIARGLRYLTRQDDPLACLINTLLTPVTTTSANYEASHYWTVDDLPSPTIVIRRARTEDYLLGLRLNESSVHYQYCYAFRNQARLFHGIVYDMGVNEHNNEGLLFLEYIPGISLRCALRQQGWTNMAPTVARVMRILKHTYDSVGYVISKITLDKVIIRSDGFPVILQGVASTNAGDSRMILLEDLRVEFPYVDILFLPDALSAIQKRYPAKKKDPTIAPPIPSTSTIRELPFRDSIGYILLHNGIVSPDIINAMEETQMTIIFNSQPQHIYHILQTIYLYLQAKKRQEISEQYIDIVRHRLNELLADPQHLMFYDAIRWLISYL